MQIAIDITIMIFDQKPEDRRCQAKTREENRFFSCFVRRFTQTSTAEHCCFCPEHHCVGRIYVFACLTSCQTCTTIITYSITSGQRQSVNNINFKLLRSQYSGQELLGGNSFLETSSSSSMDAAHKHLMDPPAGLPSSSSNMMSNVSNLTRTRSLRLGNSTNNNGLFNESFPVIGGLARSGSFRSNHRPSLAQVPCTSAVLANSLTLSPRTKHRQTLVAMKDALLKSKNLVSRKSGFDFTTNVPPSGRMSSGVYMMNGNRSGMNNTSHGSHRSSFYQSSNAFTMSTSCPDKSNIGLESPSSPVNSTSSIDSALRDLPPSTSSPMHTSSSMAMSLRRLTEEHDRLQNEYSKLRQQYIEVSSLSNLSSSSIPSSSAGNFYNLKLGTVSKPDILS